MDATRPDVMVLGTRWPERALLRAQLLEAGFEVLAIDAWPIPRLYRRDAMKPRALIVDLQGLPRPQAVLDEVRLVLDPKQVIFVMAMGTVAVADVARHGYHVVNRPVSIGGLVLAAAALLRDPTTAASVAPAT